MTKHKASRSIATHLAGVAIATATLGAALPAQPAMAVSGNETLTAPATRAESDSYLIEPIIGTPEIEDFPDIADLNEDNCRRGPADSEWRTHNATRASVYRLYCAYFLRMPDHDGYDYWYQAFADGDLNLGSISDFFASSQEFKDTYGSLSNEDFLDLLYNNIMERSPDSAGRAYWLGILEQGTLSKGSVVLQFSDSEEFRNRTGTP